MTVWQTFVTICAGIITIVTVLEKLGILGKLKSTTTDFDRMKEVIIMVNDIQKSLDDISKNQLYQQEALIALIRNELYRSFKENRNIEAWTDDEANVQTKLHKIYNMMGGNGEEGIWWAKKQEWKIVTPEEYRKLLNNKDC